MNNSVEEGLELKACGLAKGNSNLEGRVLEPKGGGRGGGGGLGGGAGRRAGGRKGMGVGVCVCVGGGGCTLTGLRRAPSQVSTRRQHASVAASATASIWPTTAAAALPVAS